MRTLLRPRVLVLGLLPAVWLVAAQRCDAQRPRLTPNGAPAASYSGPFGSGMAVGPNCAPSTRSIFGAYAKRTGGGWGTGTVNGTSYSQLYQLAMQNLYLQQMQQSWRYYTSFGYPYAQPYTSWPYPQSPYGAYVGYPGVYYPYSSPAMYGSNGWGNPYYGGNAGYAPIGGWNGYYPYEYYGTGYSTGYYPMGWRGY